MNTDNEFIDKLIGLKQKDPDAYDEYLDQFRVVIKDLMKITKEALE